MPPSDMQFGQVARPTADQTALAEFRQRAERASEGGFVGAFPNFYFASAAAGAEVGGTVFLHPAAGEWRDVPLSELQGASLDSFGDRMRATNAYASRNGFVGGFPNGFHADHGRGVVCGTVLLRPAAAEWRDVRWEQLGNPPLDDVPARFRGTHDYAVRNGFVGGFPNLFHAAVGGGRLPTQRAGTVCGTILIKQGFAEWRDVVVVPGLR